MLPPSTVLAVYGIITQQDIGKLFLAGIIPGLLAMSMYVVTIVVIGVVRPGYLPAGQPATARQRLAGLRDVWAPILLFVFVIGGLYGGLFTPTEAGGMGAGGAFLIGGAARQAVARRHPCLAAAGDPDRSGGVHRADRRAAVRLFPHHHADAPEGDRIPHRPRGRPLWRA